MIKNKKYTVWNHFEKSSDLKNINNKALKVCKECLKYDHDERPTVDQILEMEF